LEVKIKKTPYCGEPLRIVLEISPETIAELAKAVAEQVQKLPPAEAKWMTTRGQDGMKDPRSYKAKGEEGAEKVEEALREKGNNGKAAGLPEIGFVRWKDIKRFIPISSSSWYQGIKEGKFPPPTKIFGERVSAWDVRDIRRLLESGVKS